MSAEPASRSSASSVTAAENWAESAITDAPQRSRTATSAAVEAAKNAGSQAQNA